MTIERTGPVESLTGPVFRFLEDALAGISLDQEGDRDRRPDYACLHGLLVVEVKSLEGPPKGRLENAIRPATERADWPTFYGSWPVGSVLKHLADREEVEKRVNDRLGRAIRRHIKKANDQLNSHSEREPRKDAVRILVLVNEDHAEYTPDVVRFVAGRDLWRASADGSLRNSAIDAIIYLTHRHAVEMDGQVTFPISVIEGRDLDQTSWKRDVIEFVIRRWCRWNSAPLRDDVAVEFNIFEAIEHVPSRMKRHQLWALQYRRRPYMRKWKDDDVRDLWDVTMLLSMLAFGKDAPMRVPSTGVTEILEKFTHLMQETAHRGLALDYFTPEPARLRRAIASLPYGETVRGWLRNELRHLLE